MEQAVRTLKDWVAESDNIVFFGGAGVSTESGIPDFRSMDGLYNQQWAYPPETILSHSFFERDPAEFYRFYRQKLVVRLCVHPQPGDRLGLPEERGSAGGDRGGGHDPGRRGGRGMGLPEAGLPCAGAGDGL